MSTGGPLERDAPALPSESSAGATGKANLNPRDSESGQDGSGDLRARLAGLVRQPDDGPVSTPTEAYTLRVADAVLAAGFRRVVEDDGTIERLASAMAELNESAPPWPEIHDWIKNIYRDRARVVVRALREDT